MGHCIFIRYLRFPRTLWIIIIPLIFSPLLLNKSPPLRCLYGVFVIAALWVTEVVPLAVTSLLPILIFPLLGLITSKEICMNYIKDASVLFICTLMLSLAVENCKLHRRIALFMLSKIGGKPIFLIMGMLGTSAIISIWISDTAATSLMVPIAIAVTETIIRNPLEIQKKDERSRFEQTPREQLNWNQRSTSEKALLKAMMLSCSHGSLIGGTTMLTSTGPNLVFKEKIYEALGEKESGITFLTWIFFTLPPLTFYLLASLFSMQMVFFGPKSFLNIFRRTTQDEEDRANAIRAAIKVERSQLQPVSFAELSVLGWFMLLIIGWITRNPGFVEGWGELLFGSKSNYLTDSSVGILVIYMMFAWPSRPLRIFHRIDPSGGSRAVQEKQRKQDDETLLTWSLVTKRFPWSVILLIGAGFAISAAVKKSCLEELVSAKFQSHLSGANHIIVQVAITSVIPIMTEFCSNTAVASIFVPIAINLARRLRLNPLYLALPSAITPSFAFMFPMATPSNAIVYSTGLLKMWEMAVCGIILDFLCLCITTVNMNTWAWWLFRLDTVVNVTGQDFNDTCSF